MRERSGPERWKHLLDLFPIAFEVASVGTMDMTLVSGRTVTRTLPVLNNFKTIYQCFDSTFASFSQLLFLP
jgi:predicted DNA repair protein MutK